MSDRAKTSWRAIRVHGTPGGVAPFERHASERLVALYRLQTGEAPAELVFTAHGTVVHSGSDVEWDGFPVVAALEAVTCDELRRLRGLLGPDVSPDANRGGTSHLDRGAAWPLNASRVDDGEARESPPSEA